MKIFLERICEGALHALDTARAEGTPIGLVDSLIAGTALFHGATLVTRNVRELRRVDGLKIVDWY